MAEEIASKLIIFNDAALRKKQALGGDEFKLAIKLEPIHQAILSKDTSTPFSVMFSGGWGTGKTSAMAWLSDYLVKEGEKPDALNIDTCWFYPWKYQDREDVWKGLIAEVILTSMATDRVDTTMVLKAAKQFGKFLGGSFVRLLGSVKIAGGIGIPGSEIKVEPDVKEALQGIIEEYGKHVTPQDAYYNVFEHTLETWIESCYKKDERRLVIFIDDLDRCLPAIALQVLEAIKLYLNIPNVVVVVGVDREVIDAVVLKHYEDCLGEAAKEMKQKSRQYLDKMFQIEVPISPRDHQVKSFIQKQLPQSLLWERISEDHQALFEGVIEEIADINPRNVIRALNTAIVGASVETEQLAVAQAMQEALVTTVLQKLSEAQCCGVRNLLKAEHRKFFHDWSASVNDNSDAPRYITSEEEEKFSSPRDESVPELTHGLYRPTGSIAHLKILEQNYPAFGPLLRQRQLGLLMRIPFRSEPDSGDHFPTLPQTDAPDGDVAIQPNWDKLRLIIAKKSGRGFDEVPEEAIKSMERIDLTLTAADDACVACLKHCTALRGLLLTNTQVTDHGIKSLEKLTALKDLNLSYTQVTDEGIKSLEKLTALKGLSLSKTQVTDECIKSLEKLTALTFLDFDQTKITDNGIANLEKHTALAGLLLSNTQVTDHGIKNLAKLTGLLALHLRDTQVTDEGVKSLEKLTDLTDLNLEGTEVTDEGIKSLVKLTGLGNLNLDYTKVTDAGIKSLEKLTTLTGLSLVHTQVTAEGIKAFKQALPNCTVSG